MQDFETELPSLPHSLHAEKSIISVMFQDGEKMGIAIEKGISNESFYSPSHQLIFSALRKFYEEGKSPELVGIYQLFRDKGQIENVGGRGGLAELFAYSPTGGYFDNHCKIILEKEKLRGLISKCTTLVSEAYKNPEEVDELLDKAEQEIFSLGRIKEIEKFSFKSSLREETERLVDLIEGKRILGGLQTRFHMFNKAIKGLCPGNIIVIAARPSMGKTSFLCNILEDLIVERVPGYFFTLEMTREEIVRRMLYGRAQIPMHLLQEGFSPTREELQMIQKATRELGDDVLEIDETAAIRIDEARAKLRRAKKEKDIKYFAVDYVQLMRGSNTNKNYNREQEIGEISAGLKAIAKELQIPGIILAQLNRGPERRQSRIPQMSDLRESGTLEQDADIISLLFRSDYYDDDDEEEGSKKHSKTTDAALIIAKNRNGPVGSVDIKFNKEIMEFYEKM